MVMDGTEDLVEDLRRIDERLADLAYERLSAAVSDGDAGGEADERKVQQARRAVQRALHALGAAGADD